LAKKAAKIYVKNGKKTQFSNFIQYKNRSNKRSILDYDNARTELLSIEGQEYSTLAKKLLKSM